MEINKNTKSQLSNFLDNAQKNSLELKEKYSGKGIIQKIKRIFRFKDYLKYSLIQNGIIKPQLTYYSIINGNEIKTLKLISSIIKKDDVFYDIGANYGLYLNLFSEELKDGEIHAFEPMPNAFKELKKRFERNKNIHLNKTVVSDVNEPRGFYLDIRIGNAETSTLLKEMQNVAPGRYKKIYVNSIRLDKYLKHNKKPTILKIDVEGAENLVIEGGLEFFKKNNPIIILEIWGKNNKECNSKYPKKLFEFGYNCYKINENGKLSAFCEKELKNWIKAEKSSSDNFVFKK